MYESYQFLAHPVYLKACHTSNIVNTHSQLLPIPDSCFYCAIFSPAVLYVRRVVTWYRQASLRWCDVTGGRWHHSSIVSGRVCRRDPAQSVVMATLTWPDKGRRRTVRDTSSSAWRHGDVSRSPWQRRCLHVSAESEWRHWTVLAYSERVMYVLNICPSFSLRLCILLPKTTIYWLTRI